MALGNDENGKEDKSMSGFGFCVIELMAKRRMSQQKELLLALRGVGYTTKAQNLSNWLHGTRPPREFVQAVVKALNLSREEEAELYRKYVWESKALA